MPAVSLSAHDPKPCPTCNGTGRALPKDGRRYLLRVPRLLRAPGAAPGGARGREAADHGGRSRPAAGMNAAEAWRLVLAREPVHLAAAVGMPAPQLRRFLLAGTRLE